VENSLKTSELPRLTAKLLEQGRISKEQAEQFPRPALVGLVGSIDNDMCDTDYTIGTDTALHRISDAVDAISSTAASHQRIFVVTVMGRHCGYLALTGTLITGSDWFLIPENPGLRSDWKVEMVDQLKAGVGEKRALIIILAEGACDCDGNPIGSNEVKEVLEEGLKKDGEEKADVRVTILGHVQRGGSPSAFDRIMSTRQGHAAVKQILSPQAFDKPWLVIAKGNKLKIVPLEPTVEKNRRITQSVATGRFTEAMDLRGPLFTDIFNITQILMRPSQSFTPRGTNLPRYLVLHSGASCAGMNTAIRAAVRMGIALGCEIYGAEQGFEGLINGDIKKIGWTQVNGWASMGGAELGTSRKVPSGRELTRINEQLVKYGIQGILMVGGWSGYESMTRIMEKRDIFDSFDIPMVCIPATISSNLPGTEECIGADTALNNIVDAVDKIKQSAVASLRCFVVEVSGRYCGYLALMSGLATGAERVYMHEQNLTLADLLEDLRRLTVEFRDGGRRVALMIRSQQAYRSYDTTWMTALFNEESRGYFDARQSILGHLQHGGSPSPFDRILATRFACEGIHFLIRETAHKEEGERDLPCTFLGVREGEIVGTDLKKFWDLVDKKYLRAKKPWWLDLKTIAALLSREPEE